jgi:translin
MSLEMIIDELRAELHISNQAREAALAASRTLTRQCANAIRAMHRRAFGEGERLLAEASATAADLRHQVQDFPDLLSAGYTQDSLKEYAEASLVSAFLQNLPPPDAATLGVAPAAYLNGLAEAASELRRFILDTLRHERAASVEPLLAIMDEVYSLLVTIDYPDALTGGLRRTTDGLRAVLERTRGDLTAAARQDQLSAALTVFEQKIASGSGNQDAR